MTEPCKHASFAYEEAVARRTDGTSIKIGVVRCSDCGIAIGAFLPQVLDKLNSINAAVSWLPERKP